MKERIIWGEFPYPYGNAPQSAKNEYFYKMAECINDHFVRYNETDKWKNEMFEKLISKVGKPKQLTFFHRLFNL